MSEFNVDFDDLGILSRRISGFAGSVEQTINDVIHKESFKPFTESIIGHIHPSGRTWSGKKKPANSTQPFRQENGNLSITIKNKKTYQYLYFPDDGSNTVHHAGNQGFMLKGVEEQSDHIIKTITSRLIEQFEE